MGQIVKSIVTSLCALVMATGALAKDKGVSYIGHCDGFILQSSCSNGEVGCTLKYEVNKQPALTCGEGKDKKEIKPGEELYKSILKDDLNFSHYKTEWTKDQPKLCE